MTIRVYAGDRQNNFLDISNCVTGITISSSRIVKPGACTINFSYKGDITIQNGTLIKVIVDGKVLFRGYVFTVQPHETDYQLSCFDQVRYLENEDTVILENVTASGILQSYIQKFGLNAGSIDNTSFIKISIIELKKKITDILNEVLLETTQAFGELYTIYDVDGFINLKNLRTLRSNIIISDKDNVIDYDFSRSINGNTFNRFKLVKQNKDAGTFESYVAQDSAKIAQWGLLQFVREVDSQYSEAQVNELLTALPKLYGDEVVKLNTKVVGNIAIRAGSLVYVDLTKIKQRKWCLVDQCNHDFSNSGHMMDLSLLGVS